MSLRRRVRGASRRMLAVAAMIAASPVMAVADTPAETTPTQESRERPSLLTGWTFTVAPYLWLPAIEGRAGANGVTGRVDVSHRDLLDLVGDGLSLIAGFGRLEARRGRFLGFVDTSLTRLDTDQHNRIDGVDLGPAKTTPVSIDATLRLDMVFLESGFGYRALEFSLPERSRPFFAEILVGWRYYYLWGQAKARAETEVRGLPNGPQILRATRRVTSTIDWADPIIGIRWGAPLLERLALVFRGDIGGFGAGSDLAWSLNGSLQYRLPWQPCGIEQNLILGYRVLDFDYESGGTILDLNMSGPVMGLAMHF